jgi:hypothetical protein
MSYLRHNLRVSIGLDNAAFDDDGEGSTQLEVARILLDLAHKYEQGMDLTQRLTDVNGNTVGFADESKVWVKG